jgi:hypothetical protein
MVPPTFSRRNKCSEFQRLLAFQFSLEKLAYRTSHSSVSLQFRMGSGGCANAVRLFRNDGRSLLVHGVIRSFSFAVAEEMAILDYLGNFRGDHRFP